MLQEAQRKPGTHRWSILTFLSCFVLAGTTVTQTAPRELSNPVPSHTQAKHFGIGARAPLTFEVYRDEEGRPVTVLTNIHSSRLTAYVEEITPTQSSQPQHIGHAFHVVDALARSKLLSPIPRGLSIVGGLEHVVGEPYPQANVVAAIWEDGSTFGRDELIRIIVARRRVSVGEHEHAISLLQTGISQGWSAGQLLAAVRSQRAKSCATPHDPQLEMPCEFPLETIEHNLELQTSRLNGSPTSFLKELLNEELEQRDSLVKSFVNTGDTH